MLHESHGATQSTQSTALLAHMFAAMTALCLLELSKQGPLL